MDTTVVLTSTNPYGSRTLTIEADRTSSVAYLRGAEGIVHGAVWLANHVPAPAEADVGRADAGLPPVMPEAHTAHPSGRPPLDAESLSVLWFEEGDGVALYENDTLLAVIPAWADMERGLPGYARDAVGESPFAWPLGEALEGLSPRVAKARAYWRWRQAEGSWATYQQFVLGHLDSRLGTPGRYWDVGGDRFPLVGVSERPPTFTRDYTVLSTVGMSCQRMPAAEMYDTACRVELALATRQDPRVAARLFAWLGQYPWRSVTWLGHGHTARWFQNPVTFPLDGGHQGVLMLMDPPGLPDMSGFMFGGDAVRWLWLLPLTESELRLVADHGHRAISERLAMTSRI
ncbi:suppressor of fused domain protein [Microbispora sp. H10830]|uniref:suppressor of fused domain protein n=1 Tax=Microbispora sp. H10830 TaxID=2729109 RepID=UPI001601CAF0|nr:suppressor of fused domain protein [Microbispora sp. H10830]